jgi:hypothetical protein
MREPEEEDRVNVDMEPEDALRVLLGEERRETEPESGEMESAEWVEGSSTG